MIHQLYIIYSSKTDRYYIGISKELENRLDRHNKGTSRPTKSGAPYWKLVYTEEYQSRSEAMKREYYLKRMKSRAFIEQLINQEK